MSNKRNKNEYRDYIARLKGFKNHKEYLDKLAKDKGFDNYLAYINYRIKEKGFKNRSDYYNHLSQQRGFNNYKEEYLFKKGFKTTREYNQYLFKSSTGYDYIYLKTRLNDFVKGRGFESYKEFIDIMSTARGLPDVPNIICDDRDNPNFIGHIAEYGISMIFKNIKGTFFSNRGYDFICEGLKIDVKGSALRSNNSFAFSIKQNEIADYFMLICIDNALDLTPLHFWAIKGLEPIRGIPLKDKDQLLVLNNKNSISYLQKFEKDTRLADLKQVFIKYNKDSGIYDETITKSNILERLQIPLDSEIEKILDIIKEKQKKRRFNNRIIIYPKEECNK